MPVFVIITTYFVQKGNNRDLVKDQHMWLVEVMPAVQELLIILIIDLKYENNKN